ncbi:AtpZ/AtpI family protein [Celeribacter marinus]|uniref:AtpZ/AtpI family protein n=1 Tax=Celeribacter marinus TaxID=1397108 RepID=UPI003F6D5275
MTDPHEPERLRALEERIAKAKGAQAPRNSKGEEHFSQANMAWRMVVELIAGLLIGFGIGYTLDGVFGTLPIFLVLFVGLGLVAGVKTMMRTAAEIQKQQLADVDVENNAGTPAGDERD